MLDSLNHAFNTVQKTIVQAAKHPYAYIPVTLAKSGACGYLAGRTLEGLGLEHSIDRFGIKEDVGMAYATKALIMESLTLGMLLAAETYNQRQIRLAKQEQRPTATLIAAPTEAYIVAAATLAGGPQFFDYLIKGTLLPATVSIVLTTFADSAMRQVNVELPRKASGLENPTCAG